MMNVGLNKNIIFVDFVAGKRDAWYTCAIKCKKGAKEAVFTRKQL